MWTIIIIPDRSANPVSSDCLTLSHCALLSTSDVVMEREGDETASGGIDHLKITLGMRTSGESGVALLRVGRYTSKWIIS